MAHDFFLSYRRADKAFARSLVEEITARGATIWWDEMIPAGVDWRDAIADNLNSAEVIIILFSEACNDSKQLRKELALADDLNKMVIPVLIEDTKPKGHFLFELAARNWIQAFPEAERKIDSLSVKLLEIVGYSPSEAARLGSVAVPPAPSDNSAPAPKPSPIAKRKVRKTRNILPFKLVDLPIVLGAPLLIYLVTGLNPQSTALYEVIIGSLFYGTCFIAAYGTIAFPIRYFLRNLKLADATRYYIISSGTIFAFGASLLLAFAVFEGRWANDMTTLLFLSIMTSAGFAILAFIIYGALMFARSTKLLRSRVEII
ncbi:MAG TPA: hypothetical protein DHV57_05490 [Hyphomonas sp.]|uniref:toll/interleukin-1 receptor domain-containing protein n=1 Tax=Hyphomonas sp. UBA5107 TaxID=1946636 RepID=UPI000C4BFDEB|nr:toll/interleukin-1 receptor domain-containing protein [Hyphomonas sp. UBA5107]MAA83519.1 hypothetical protein [Hyphomonas sp.]MAN65579.1 hypothetical protein [Hyphomonadaceae bacterium]HBL93837.1 hypothetical protein [Hyphomonas sp.]HCJ16857.1 hypothetical protein [Hyphomonas sp.]HCN92004.1 hypothetical protein [Hyphomonas sp.]|tara:strand:+ start:13776 stop:14723 length:948 start_codon:yes stop_codon:yes gene_type:complete